MSVLKIVKHYFSNQRSRVLNYIFYRGKYNIIDAGWANATIILNARRVVTRIFFYGGIVTLNFCLILCTHINILI